MKKALTIIRVSEEDQLKGYGPDAQADEVRDYLVEAGLVEVDCRAIQEESTTWNRPQFEAALEEAIDLKRRGNLEAVVFPRTDRLARKWDAFGYYLGKLRREGLEVHFARERTLAPDDPMQAAMLFLYGAKAHADADTIRENTSKGRRMRAERDHMMPTGRSKWAHDYHPYRRDWGKARDGNSGRYTINPERAAWVRKWADWLLVDGLSINGICKLMAETYGLKISRSTVVGVLSDPALIGKFYAYTTRVVRDAKGKRKVNVEPKDWVLVYEDAKQAILEEEQFYALKERFQRNRANSPRHTKYWYPPLRSLIFHSCGRRMVGVYLKHQPYYRCLPCGAWTKAVPLWEQIRAGIGERLLDPGRLIPAVRSQLMSGQSMNGLQQDLKVNRQRLDMLAKAEAKALRLHLYLPNYPVEKLNDEVRRIAEQGRQLEAEQSKLEQQLAELQQAMVDEEGLRRFCEIATRNVDSLDDGHWRMLLETMKLRILVDNSGITAKIAVPTVKDEKSVIVVGTSRSNDR
jgi:DNA invertase Pin-like site-specific DNA recombinase